MNGAMIGFATTSNLNITNSISNGAVASTYNCNSGYCGYGESGGFIGYSESSAVFLANLTALSSISGNGNTNYLGGIISIANLSTYNI
jgi:hypothetical protein